MDSKRWVALRKNFCITLSLKVDKDWQLTITCTNEGEQLCDAEWMNLWQNHGPGKSSLSTN